MKKLQTLLVALALPVFLFAQEKWEGGVYFGIINYGGDLVEPSVTFKESNLMYGVYLRNYLLPKLAVRANLLHGKIAGSDKNFDELVLRNVNFEASITELAVRGEFNFLGKQRYYGDTLSGRFAPYVFGGIGLILADPDTDFSKSPSNPAEIQKDKDADFSKIHFSLPIGAGLMYNINNKWTIGLEYGIRLTFSDYLDGVKYTGNSDKNDVYFSGGLTLGYRFGKTLPN